MNQPFELVSQIEQEISTASIFSEELKDDKMQLTDDGRGAKYVGSDYSSAIINHPGFNSGVLQWEIEVEMKGRVVMLGVSPAHQQGKHPGHSTMPGSIGMSKNARIYINGERRSRGFRFTSCEVISIILDLQHHTVSWILNNDVSTTVTRPLPSPTQPYVLAVGLYSGSACTIRSFNRLSPDDARVVQCPQHPCEWTGHHLHLQQHVEHTHTRPSPQ